MSSARIIFASLPLRKENLPPEPLGPPAGSGMDGSSPAGGTGGAVKGFGSSGAGGVVGVVVFSSGVVPGVDAGVSVSSIVLGAKGSAMHLVKTVYSKKSRDFVSRTREVFILK